MSAWHFLETEDSRGAMMPWDEEDAWKNGKMKVGEIRKSGSFFSQDNEDYKTENYA